MREPISRRTFVRGAAATGIAATGIAVGGTAAAQADTSVNANQLFGSGLVVVQGINVQDLIDVNDVEVTVVDGPVTVTVTDVEILNDNVVRILNDVEVSENLNQNQVTVQVLSGGEIGQDVVNVPGNL